MTAPSKVAAHTHTAPLIINIQNTYNVQFSKIGLHTFHIKMYYAFFKSNSVVFLQSKTELELIMPLFTYGDDGSKMC